MRERDLHAGVTLSQCLDHRQSLQALAYGRRMEPDSRPRGIALLFPPTGELLVRGPPTRKAPCELGRARAHEPAGGAGQTQHHLVCGEGYTHAQSIDWHERYR